MPEGDTLWRTARRLNSALAGETLERADLRWGNLDGAVLRADVTTEVVARGKHILHRTAGGWTLHSHLRMEGQWRVAALGSSAEAAALRRHTLRAAVGTSQWTALGLRLGMLDLVRTDQEHRLVGHLGPDVLGPDWDAAQAAANLAAAGAAASELTIAAALLDQRLLAGVGTYWASEALFILRIHPWRPVSEIDADTLLTLTTRIHTLMSRGARNAIQSSTGLFQPGATSYVHGRSGRPCRRCGTTVRVAMAGQAPRERTIFSCPTCQGGLAPTDDGRPQRPLGSSPRRS
ncbi:DNA-formamidopyrimidine glycosylase family protein [Janibacter sp. GXQ6167]|uniref:DNA-formamidopyrimidine glycosylase family protein n=1 Tax=Janibacter sp. GXQ6167 TaxID=3240791 RepID=UPI003524BC64